MNQTAAFTGQDTLILDNRLVTGFADGDVFKLDFPNDTGVVKVGKNGNSIFVFNNTGLQCTGELRLLLGCDDDIYFNQRQAQWNANPPGFIAMSGQFIKNVGDGNGNIRQVIYQVEGGIFKKGVPATSNADGDVNQAISVFSLIFSNTPRNVV